MEHSGTLPTNSASEMIAQQDAQDFIDNYYNDCVTNKGETPANVLKAMSFDRESLEDILSNENVMKVRFYIGKPSVSGDPTFIAVGVDRYNENILDKIYDNATPCPSDCPGRDFANSERVVLKTFNKTKKRK